MSYLRKRLPSGIVETVVSGDVDLAEALNSIADLSSYVTDGALYECVIHHDDDDAHITVSYDAAKYIISEAGSFFDTLKKGAVAFVAHNPLLFGLCRQLQMRINNDRVQVAVFKHRETALQWLEEMSVKPVNFDG